MDHDVRLRFRAPWRSLAHAAGASARAALGHQHAAPGGLTVILVGDSEMRRLHHTFAGDEGPTDVLSFPDGACDPETGARYYGDIFVCIAAARRQARQAGHSLEAEVRLLTVHGVLHLLGFDHADPPGRSRMWAVQAAVLGSTPAPESR